MNAVSKSYLHSVLCDNKLRSENGHKGSVKLIEWWYKDSFDMACLNLLAEPSMKNEAGIA